MSPDEDGRSLLLRLLSRLLLECLSLLLLEPDDRSLSLRLSLDEEEEDLAWLEDEERLWLLPPLPPELGRGGGGRLGWDVGPPWAKYNGCFLTLHYQSFFFNTYFPSA